MAQEEKARKVLNITDGGLGRISLYAVGQSRFAHMGAVGVRLAPGNAGGRPDLWLMSDGHYMGMELEKRNLIRAKVRAIVGTAVMGACLALVLGVLINTKSSQPKN
jgi:hypothetical protein